MPDEQEKIIIEIDDFESGERQKKDTLRVLAFSLDKENYCIDITQAREVFTPGSVTRVPNTASFVKGVTNLHGDIIPLVDIRFFLGLAGSDVTHNAKAIVAEIEGGFVGVVVDKIFAAREIEKSSIQPPLATLKGRVLDFTIGQIENENGIIALLDLKKILGSEEFISTNKGGAV